MQYKLNGSHSNDGMRQKRSEGDVSDRGREREREGDV